MLHSTEPEVFDVKACFPGEALVLRAAESRASCARVRADMRRERGERVVGARGTCIPGGT